MADDEATLLPRVEPLSYSALFWFTLPMSKPAASHAPMGASAPATGRSPATIARPTPADRAPAKAAVRMSSRRASYCESIRKRGDSGAGVA